MHSRLMDRDIRATKILMRARALYRSNAPDLEWPSPAEAGEYPWIREMQLSYLKQAEEALISEGALDQP